MALFVCFFIYTVYFSTVQDCFLHNFYSSLRTYPFVGYSCFKKNLFFSQRNIFKCKDKENCKGWFHFVGFTSKQINCKTNFFFAFQYRWYLFCSEYLQIVKWLSVYLSQTCHSHQENVTWSNHFQTDLQGQQALQISLAIFVFGTMEWYARKTTDSFGTTW